MKIFLNRDNDFKLSPVTFKSMGKFACSTLMNLKLEDAVSHMLGMLAKGDYLVLSKNKSDKNTLSKVGVLAMLFTGKIKDIFHINNNKFDDVVVLRKNNYGGTEFINVNNYAVDVSTSSIINNIPVEPYHQIGLENGSRIWGSNKRSLLLKDKPELTEDAAQYVGLAIETYDSNELNGLLKKVNKPTPHTYHNFR